MGPTYEPRYYAIISFDIPLTGVPLRTWAANQKDSYTLIAGTKEITIPLVYVSNSPPDLRTRDIWCYGQYLEMCNNALQRAHDQLSETNPEIGPKPIMIKFNPETRLFTHWLPSAYSSVQLYTTYSVARMFANMGGNNPLAVGYPSGLPKEFQITSQGSTFVLSPQGEGYNVLTQEFPSLYAWHDLQSIDLIVNGEQMPLTDLVPLQSEGRAPYAYTATTEPRWLRWPFASSVQLNVTAIFTMGGGPQRQLYMNAGDSFRIVFAFP